LKMVNVCVIDIPVVDQFSNSNSFVLDQLVA